VGRSAFGDIKTEITPIPQMTEAKKVGCDGKEERAIKRRKVNCAAERRTANGER
jgi:hypothetical protein